MDFYYNTMQMLHQLFRVISTHCCTVVGIQCLTLSESGNLRVCERKEKCKSCPETSLYIEEIAIIVKYYL